MNRELLRVVKRAFEGGETSALCLRVWLGLTDNGSNKLQVLVVKILRTKSLLPNKVNKNTQN